jgi:hypothetical protein
LTERNQIRGNGFGMLGLRGRFRQRSAGIGDRWRRRYFDIFDQKVSVEGIAKCGFDAAQAAQAAEARFVVSESIDAEVVEHDLVNGENAVL